MTSSLTELILSHVPKNGAFIGNGRMRTLLRKDQPKLTDEGYVSAKEELIADGRLQRGRGRGGSIRRATEKRKRKSIRLDRVGPIREAEVELGDLTILVGPQASGKSIFLQTLKLVMDRNHILGTFDRQNIDFGNDPEAMLNGYYGRGMGGMLQNDPYVTWERRRYGLGSLTCFKRPRDKQVERLFYIPAQRVVSFRSGISKTFGDFDFGDPYVLRHFAHRIHLLLQNEFGRSPTLFPVTGRLNDMLKRPIAERVFGSAELMVETRDFTRTLSLKVDGLSEGLPFLAWSAGQREFVPLLLGLYWLCPAGRMSRRENIEWVVIEEPETGLHPRAIETFLLLVLELMKRGYRVLISTHSTVMLDFVWAVRNIQECSGQGRDLLKLFGLRSNSISRDISESALRKHFRVYFFERGEAARDITELDPESEDEFISNWGDLDSFSERTANVVAGLAPPST